jgi:hypothetical protein
VKLFRTIVASFLVLLGVMMIVTWGITSKSVEAIDNGQAAGKLTDKVLSSPAVADLAADKAEAQIYEQLSAQFDSRAFELVWGFAQEPIHDAIVSVIGSDFVANSAQAGADRAQAALVTALTEEDRPYGPLMLTIDISPRINARIDQVPVVGGIIPDITVPALEVEVIPADTFEDMRSAYSAAKAVATWFIWIGLALIALGVVVSPRRRWFLARSMLVAGVIVLAVGFAIGAMGAHTIARFMPGGTEGGLGTAVEDLLSDTAIPPIADLLIALGIAALILALLSALAGRFIPVFNTKMRERRDANRAPLVHEPMTAPAPSGQPVAVAAQEPVPTVSSAVAGASASTDAPSATVATVPIDTSPREATTLSLPVSVPTSLPIPDEQISHPIDGDSELDDTELEDYEESVADVSPDAPADSPAEAPEAPVAAATTAPRKPAAPRKTAAPKKPVTAKTSTSSAKASRSATTVSSTTASPASTDGKKPATPTKATAPKKPAAPKKSTAPKKPTQRKATPTKPPADAPE